MHTRTPLHAASSHLRTPQCYCFSLCSTSEIPPFRASIPQLVTSTASPWFLYLRAVYGDLEEGALPFNLGKLDWWYHQGWSNLSGVEWPMPQCVRSGSGWSRDPSAAPCDEPTCARWRAREGEPTAGSANAAYEMNVFFDHNRGTQARGSLGSSVWDNFKVVMAQFYKTRDANHESEDGAIERLSREQLGRQITPGRGWAEVVRFDEKSLNLGGRYNGFGEGRNGYGVWFWPAKGSGVFINVGNTLALHHKASDARLVRRFEANASVGHNATRDYVRANRVPERAPMMAFAVGLDSVQFQMNKMRHGAEMVLTRRACMGFQEGAVEPVRTCPPTACTELRTGWKASWVCRCNDNASALLNCAG